MSSSNWRWASCEAVSRSPDPGRGALGRVRSFPSIPLPWPTSRVASTRSASTSRPSSTPWKILASQWRCVMPREISDDRYRGLRAEQGLAAVRALEVGDAMTHLEGFLAGWRPRLAFGRDAPAGSRVRGSGRCWGLRTTSTRTASGQRVAVDGCFDGPWARTYAVGTGIFLRGVGRGRVDRVEGLGKRFGGKWVMNWSTAACSRAGRQKSRSYTGDRLHHGPASRD